HADHHGSTGALHRALGNTEFRANLLVEQALKRKVEYLPLTPRKALYAPRDRLIVIGLLDATQVRVGLEYRGQCLRLPQGLFEKSERAGVNGLLRIHGAPVPGHDDDGPATTCGTNPPEKVETAHPRHHEIHEDAAGTEFWKGIQERLPSLERPRLDSHQPEQALAPFR